MKIIIFETKCVVFQLYTKYSTFVWKMTTQCYGKIMKSYEKNKDDFVYL